MRLAEAPYLRYIFNSRQWPQLLNWVPIANWFQSRQCPPNFESLVGMLQFIEMIHTLNLSVFSDSSICGYRLWGVNYWLICVKLDICSLLQHVKKHLHNLLRYERHRPCEHIHEIRENVRMWRIIELLYVKGVLFELYDCSFVVVYVTVVWGREYRYHSREFLSAVPFVHFIAIELRFMRPQNW